MDRKPVLLDLLGATRTRPESWTADVDRGLAQAMRESPLLSVATPKGGVPRAELVRAAERGTLPFPGWTYEPHDRARARAVADVLEGLAREVERREPAALARAYAARARELALEALLTCEVGQDDFAHLARQRFPPERVATTLAEGWVREPNLPEDEALDATTDGPEAWSLLSRLREEVGRRRLAFRVVVSDTLAPLAATGERTIWVAAKRTIGRIAVERTVLHEIEGHALPRHRAALLELGLFALGTARGVDEQEGYALFLEERHGFLRGARRRELAFRHRAVEAMDAGADFVEVVRTLMNRDAAPAARAVAAAERAFRGSAGERPGLGRERVYLASYLRVTARLRAQPEDEAIASSGQVAVEWMDALREALRED